MLNVRPELLKIYSSARPGAALRLFLVIPSQFKTETLNRLMQLNPHLP